MTRGFARTRLALGVAGSVLAPALAGCAATASVPAPVGVPARTVAANLFFSTGRTLLEEPRVVNADDKYGDTLAQLLKATPTSNTQVAVVQPESKVNGVTLKDGVLTVDWAPEVLGFKAKPSEQVLAWAAIMETFGQFPEVKQVRFTVDGKTSGTLDGRDVGKFWGRITLKGQPWAATRPPDYATASAVSSGTVDSSGTVPAGK